MTHSKRKEFFTFSYKMSAAIIILTTIGCIQEHNYKEDIDSNKDGEVDIVRYFKKNRLIKEEILYKYGLIEKEVIYWKDKDTVTKIILEYRPSEAEPSARQYYKKPLVRFFKNASEINIDNNRLMLQEIDLSKTYGLNTNKILSKSYILTHNQKILFTKVIFKDGVISDVVITDDNGKKNKVFVNHGHDEFFDILYIYDDSGKKITSKIIKIPTSTSLIALRAIN